MVHFKNSVSCDLSAALNGSGMVPVQASKGQSGESTPASDYSMINLYYFCSSVGEKNLFMLKTAFLILVVMNLKKIHRSVSGVAVIIVAFQAADPGSTPG